MANGNDSAIVENGGELNTDDYSDIKLINKTEYDSLEDTENLYGLDILHHCKVKHMHNGLLPKMKW